MLGNVRENGPLGLIWSLRNATKIFLLDPQIDSLLDEGLKSNSSGNEETFTATFRLKIIGP